MAAKFNEVCVVTFVLAMAVLMVLLPRRAGAQECLPPNEAVAKVTAGHPIDQMIMLNAEQTARVSAWWDAYPPVSEDHYDFVINP
jgi:hypothetical protein